MLTFAFWYLVVSALCGAAQAVTTDKWEMRAGHLVGTICLAVCAYAVHGVM